MQGLRATQHAPSGFPRSSIGLALLPLPMLPVRLKLALLPWTRPWSLCLSWAFLARFAMYRTLLWLLEEVLRTRVSSTDSSSDSLGLFSVAKSLAVRGSTLVSFRSCSVKSLGGRDFCGLPLRSWSLVGLIMKLRLMLRYLLSKLQEMSSEVRSPRLLDMEAVAFGVVAAEDGLLADDCLSPSM